MPASQPLLDRYAEVHSRPSLGKSLAKSLTRGLAAVLPLFAALWILWWTFIAVDELIPMERLFGRQIRGLGIVLVLTFAFLVGLLIRIPVVRWLAQRSEALLLQIPLFRLLYSTLRDFVNAFLRKKRFDKPVLVKLGGGFDAEVIGFITRQNLEAFGILDKVAVYFPQSYNIGGNVLILPKERLTPIPADSSMVMSFIVTGGIANGDADGGLEVPRRTRATGTLEVCPQEG